jgi:hypothetical protein
MIEKRRSGGGVTELDSLTTIQGLNDRVGLEQPGGWYRLCLDRQSRCQIHDMADQIGHRVGGETHDITAHRVSNQHVARLEHVYDRGTIGRKRGILLYSTTMAGELNRERRMATLFEFRDQHFPAPRTVETPMNQN